MFLHYSNENLGSKVLLYDEINVIMLTIFIILNKISKIAHLFLILEWCLDVF